MEGAAAHNYGCALAAYPDLQSGKLLFCFLARLVRFAIVTSLQEKKPCQVLRGLAGLLCLVMGYCYPKHKEPSLQAREGFFDLEHLTMF